jgi:fructokinase
MRQKSGDYVLCFGEMLWDMLPSGKLPGGAPMNVALHLRNLGIDVALISKVGNDHLGEEIVDFVRKKDCSTDGIQHDSHHSTGIVEVNISNRTSVTYNIVHPAAWDFISALPEALDASKNAYAFVYGTLPCRDMHSRKTLLTLLDNSTALKIYDVNLRPPHFTKELVETLLQKANVVKMNEDELKVISGWFDSDDLPIEQKAKRIKTKFGLQAVILTMGGDGALLLNETGLHQSKVYKVEVKDTIGSGDSFLAAMIKNLYLKKSPEYSLNYACALGALVAQHHGANPPIKEVEILEFMKR